MKIALIVTAVALATAIATPASAQSLKPSEPCCGITSIDFATGTVTATDRNGGTMRFRPADRSQLKMLKVGQKVFADAGSNEVRVAANVDIKGVLLPVTVASVKPGEPCCDIIAIDLRSGIIVAHEPTNGRVFKFQVMQPSLLRSLKIGQKVYADFDKGKVGLMPGEPCCGIKP